MPVWLSKVPIPAHNEKTQTGNGFFTIIVPSVTNLVNYSISQCRYLKILSTKCQFSNTWASY